MSLAKMNASIHYKGNVMKLLIAAIVAGLIGIAAPASAQTAGTDTATTTDTPKPIKKAKKKMKRTAAKAKAKARQGDDTMTAGTVTKENAAGERTREGVTAK
jgi:exosome complex RNA-binding protein Rrp42 (RNase PH superfamily)